MFDDLAGGGVIAERPQRATHLVEPLLAVRQVHRGHGLEISRSGPCPGSTVRRAQALQPLERLEVVAEAAVFGVDHGGPAAQHGVRGQDGVVEQE